MMRRSAWFRGGFSWFFLWLSDGHIAHDVTGLAGDLGGLGAGISRHFNGGRLPVFRHTHKVGVSGGGVVGVECDHGFSLVGFVKFGDGTTSHRQVPIGFDQCKEAFAIGRTSYAVGGFNN